MHAKTSKAESYKRQTTDYKPARSIAKLPPMPDASTPLHIVFLGTAQPAVPLLQALATDPRFAIDLVITQPDRPVGRKQILTASPVKAAAQQLNLPVFQPEKLNREVEQLRTLLQDHLPDFMVVVAYGQILSQAVLDLPRIAPVNVHFSLFPRWRGASPVQHAILAGDAVTGVSVQKMVRELDAGPVLSQRSLPLNGTETTPQLMATLAELGAELLPETLTQPLTPVEQDHTRATFCRTFTRDDGALDHTALTAVEIDRHVRAFTPWPGVLLTVDGEPLKILASSLAPTAESAALPCAGGTVLHLVSVQPPGKKPMSGKAWALGKR